MNKNLLKLDNLLMMPFLFNFSIPKILFFALFYLGLAGSVSAQFKKAHELYLEKRFAQAIPLYEAGLQEKENILAQARLANSYRMLNQMEKAENLYEKLVNAPRVQPDTYRFYAETLMANAKYEQAKTWFSKYQELKPEDSTTYTFLKACDLAPSLKPYFRGITIKEFEHNSEQDDNTAVIFDGQIVFTSDRSSGSLLNQKSGFTGREYLRMYGSSYDTNYETFLAPTDFSQKLNAFSKNTANPSFSRENTTVYFSQNSDLATERGEYKLQLFQAAEKSKGRWGNITKLEFCKNEFNYMHPAVSADQKKLFFASDTKGEGGFDIFMAQKKGDSWSRPINLGPQINTQGHEAFPYFHHDGRLFFCSKGHPGMGGFDVFVSQYDSIADTWSAALNLGRPINSSVDDISFFLTPNDSAGVFASSRSGGDDDLFVFWIGERAKLLDALKPVSRKAEMYVDSLPALLPTHFEGHPSMATLQEDLVLGIISETKAYQIPILAAEKGMAPSDSLILMDLMALLEHFPTLLLTIEVHGNEDAPTDWAGILTESWRQWLQQNPKSNRLLLIESTKNASLSSCVGCPAKFVKRLSVKASTKVE